MDLFKSIELANLYNQAPTEHLEKAIRARHPESGRWVTLNGGTSNETGDHHGVHVFVEGGKITKGPKNLVGKEPEKAPEPPKEEPKKKATRKPRQKDHMKEADALRDESDRLNAQGHMSDHDHYISRDHHRQIDMYNKRHRLAIDPEDQEYAGKSRDNEIQKLHEHVAKSRKFNDKITAAQKETLLRVKNAHKVPEFAKVYHEDIKNGMAHVEALNKHLHASDRVDKHKVEDHLNELARINMRLKKHRKNYM